MTITNWPATERPREKLRRFGAHNLTDIELLAIFLGSGVRGKSAIDLARELIAHCGGLSGIFSADESRFCAIKGLGETKYIQWQAILEIQRRHLKQGLEQGISCQSAREVEHFLISQLRPLAYEVFGLLFLNSQHRLIDFQILFRGTLQQTAIHPREVIKKALFFNAASVILAHNHPGGSSEPSEMDKSTTQYLKQALRAIDVEVLDHIIVGAEACSSFAQRRML